MTHDARLPATRRGTTGRSVLPAANPLRMEIVTEFWLRRAGAADAVAVADVYIESRKHLLPFAPVVHPDHDIRRWINDHLLRTSCVTVAVHRDRVIAMCATSNDGTCEWIDQLYVAPSCIGQGVGTALLGEAIARLANPIRLYTFAQNLRARRFYERHGFAAIVFGDGSGNEEGVPDVLYERDVRAPPR
jgi:GNAT superfamily N-acetyltransferase